VRTPSCAGVLPEVIWMSEASAEAYEPGEREVCISIRDPAAPLPPLSPQFLAVLSLEFDDDPEPGLGGAPPPHHGGAG
jgi:hypothetical protein